MPGDLTDSTAGMTLCRVTKGRWRVLPASLITRTPGARGIYAATPTTYARARAPTHADVQVALQHEPTRHSQESRRLTDAAVELIAYQCPSLKRLSLRHCAAVTNRGLEIIAANLAELVELDVVGCGGADEGLLAFSTALGQVARSCGQLRRVVVHGCLFLADEDASSLADVLHRVSCGCDACARTMATSNGVDSERAHLRLRLRLRMAAMESSMGSLL